MAYVQKNNPFSVTPCGRRRSFMTTDNPVDFNSESPFEKRLRKTTKGKGRNFRTVEEGDGGYVPQSQHGLTKKPVFGTDEYYSAMKKKRTEEMGLTKRMFNIYDKE